LFASIAPVPTDLRPCTALKPCSRPESGLLEQRARQLDDLPRTPIPKKASMMLSERLWPQPAHSVVLPL
jgi:hypothetical protein